MKPSTTVPAAAYIRMSGKGQEKSPAEQKTEITKLATREGFQVVEWCTDEAITGNSTTDERPGLLALLTAAKAGAFKVVLAWHTNRISREDPMDAVVFYNQLRKAGVGLHTCCEGAIDLDSFTAQLLLFVNQKASNDYLVELSAKALRGKLATAKAGAHCGGPAHYGMDRGEFDAEGRLVRRLRPGDVKSKGHHVRLIPGVDPQKVAAIRYAFDRMDSADIGVRELGREMDAKGFPSPYGATWNHKAVTRLLTSPVYTGTTRWGWRASGRYHEVHGEDIIPVVRNGNGKRPGKTTEVFKPAEEAITVVGACAGIIPAEQFERVQRKLGNPDRSRRKKSRARAAYPLRDLIVCEHCGKPMYGQTRRFHDGRNRLPYHKVEYICQTYSNHGRGTAGNQTCGHHTIEAARVTAWVIHALQQAYLGPGRAALVEETKRELKRQNKGRGKDSDRLQKRATELDREVGRLVKAIRTIDAAELVEELAIVRAERDKVRAELAQASTTNHVEDIDAEAERIADGVRDLTQKLNDSDPAIVREVLHQFVYRIPCRWDQRTTEDGRLCCSFHSGEVELWEQGLGLPPQASSMCQVVAPVSRRGSPSSTGRTVKVPRRSVAGYRPGAHPGPGRSRSGPGRWDTPERFSRARPAARRPPLRWR